MSHAAGFAAMFVALYAAHQVGDHWVQTDRQASRKGAPGWPGRWACTGHIATYTATAALALAPVVLWLGIHPAPWRAAAGLAFSAVTHWVIDRRRPLIAVADLVGLGRFVRLGAPRPGRDDNPTLGTGHYVLDQAAHVAMLMGAALIIA